MSDELKKKENNVDEFEEIMKKEVKLIRKIFFEIVRVLPLLAIAVPFLFTDDSWKIVMFGISILSFSLFITHIIRKTLHPYIDLEVLVKKALQHPIGAGISFFGVMIFLSVMLICFIFVITK